MIVECRACKTQNRLPAARVTSRAHCGHCKAALLPLSSPLSISTEEDFRELIENAPVPVVVDFWADWCRPCHMVAPELEKLAHSKSGNTIVAKIDTEALPRVASRFRIQSIPTMVLFRRGNEVKRMTGAASAANIAANLAL